MIKSSLIACAVLAATFQARAVDFSVTGVITPGACTMSFPAGGIAAYGTLTTATVKSTFRVVENGGFRRYESAWKPVALSITCPTATKFALSFADNRAASVKASSVDTSTTFGLGQYGSGSAGVNIGNYVMKTESFRIKRNPGDAGAIPLIWVTPGVATPSSVFTRAVDPESISIVPHNKSVGYATTSDDGGPEALSEVIGNVEFLIELDTTLVDTATSDITLDGSGTLTLIIL